MPVDQMDEHGCPSASVAAGGALGSDRVVAPSNLVVGIDVGGTKTLAVVHGGRGPGSASGVGPGGQVWRADGVVARIERPTRVGGAEELPAFLDEVLVEAATTAGVEPAELEAAAVGLPGMVDPGTGHLRHAVNLGVGGVSVDVAGVLGARVSGPVDVENDVNLAALGAAAALDLTGDVAFLSIGTGLALGLVLGGRVHHGALGAAGEIGHVPIEPGGLPCACGQRGCLETVASGRAIADAWPQDHTGGSGNGGRQAGGATSDLLQAAAVGDPRAVAVRDRVFDHLAWAVTLIGQLVDPDVIVLGGGVAEAGEPLRDEVQRALERRASRAPFLAALDLPSRLRMVPPGLDAGAVGAVTAARSLLVGAQR